VLPDPRLIAIIVGRITFDTGILETGTGRSQSDRAIGDSSR
jgi:hypothetical protein